MKEGPGQGRMGARIVRIADLGGTALFAMEGALAGIAAGFDPVGVTVLAFFTALGGGLIRDVVIGVRPAAVDGWTYAALVLIVTAGTWVLWPVARGLPPFQVMLLDAGGLALFVVAGTGKALDHGIHALPAIFLGTVGGVGGGVVRDVLLNIIPRILHADVYASAALLGAAVVAGGRALKGDARVVALAGGLVCFGVRVVAYGEAWHLPRLVGV